MSFCSTKPAKNHYQTRKIKGKVAVPYEEILREKCTTRKGERCLQVCVAPKNIWKVN